MRQLGLRSQRKRPGFSPDPNPSQVSPRSDNWRLWLVLEGVLHFEGKGQATSIPLHPWGSGGGLAPLGLGDEAVPNLGSDPMLPDL